MHSPSLPRATLSAAVPDPDARVVRADPPPAARCSMSRRCRHGSISSFAIAGRRRGQAGRPRRRRRVLPPAQPRPERPHSVHHPPEGLPRRHPAQQAANLGQQADGRPRPRLQESTTSCRTCTSNHFTNFWRTLIFSQTSNQQLAVPRVPARPLAAACLKDNLPYDRMVAELLTAQGQSFYQANENKPENIAGNTSRLFLGVKLECAQCHDDRSGPRGYWTRDQFWEYAAFFATGNGPVRCRRRSTIPGQEPDVVQAQFLDGRSPTGRTATIPAVVWPTG